MQRDGKWILLGAAEIRVLSRMGTVYAAPNLIYHYVSAHGYKPPEEFLDAALTGIPPASEQYERFLKDEGFKWWPTKIRQERATKFRFVRTPKGVEKVEE